MPLVPARALARRALRLALATLLTCMFAVTGPTLVAAPAAAADGMALAGKAAYVVSGTNEPVDVTLTVTATNRMRSTATSLYFFETLSAWLPAKPTGLTATAQGARLRVTTSKEGGLDLARVTLPSRLLYGQSVTVVLRYRIAGSPPRSTESSRVGPGYAAFTAYAPGDAGKAEVTVSAPKSMTFSSDAGFSSVGGSNPARSIRKLTSTRSDDGVWTRVSLRDSAKTLTSRVDVGDDTLTIVAWPGDQKWSAFVRDQVTAVVPVLASLTDTPWPAGSIEIREDGGIETRGYSGLFDSSAGAITVGDGLDAPLLYHELAHAWSNSRAFSERWLSEGVADVLSDRASADQGVAPIKRATVSPSQKSAFPLTEWQHVTGSATGADAYGYPASKIAVAELMEPLSDAQFRAVLKALVGGESAYDVAGEPPLDRGPKGWQQVLDVVELVGGNDDAREVVTTWVLTEAQADTLTERSSARTAYAAADAADGPWHQPRGVRLELARWEFDDAQRALAATEPLGAQAKAVQDAAATVDLPVSDTLRLAYELADGTATYEAVGRDLVQASTAFTTFGAARAAIADTGGPMAGLGALMTRPEEHLADAERELRAGQLVDGLGSARAAITAVERSVGVGLMLIGGTILALTLLLVLIRRGVRG